MQADNSSNESFMRHWCATCEHYKPVCCGDNTNGFWCHDCCPHPYDEREDDYPYDDEDTEEATIPSHQISPLAKSDRMVVARAFDGSEKAIVSHVHGGTPEQADANWRLITAAPMLYEELELAADTFRDFSAVLRAIGKDTMAAAADIAERHIREHLSAVTSGAVAGGEGPEGPLRRRR